MRIAVVSNTSGSGKTTVARRLSQRLRVPHVELDAIQHLSGWRTNPDFEPVVAAAVARPGWVIDGNYFDRLGTAVVEAADLVVWLDIPLRVCLQRLALRTARRYLGREELWNGNREQLREALFDADGLFRFAIRNYGRRRAAFPRLLAPTNHVRIRSDRELEALMAAITSAQTSSADPPPTG